MVDYKIKVINDAVNEFSIKAWYYADPFMDYLHCIITDNIVVTETMIHIGINMSVESGGPFEITGAATDTDEKSIKYRFKMNKDEDNEYELASSYQPKDSNFIVSLHSINKPCLHTHYCIKINGPKEPLKVVSKFYSPDSKDDEFVSVCDKMNELIENEVIKKWGVKDVGNVSFIKPIISDESNEEENEEDVNNE